MPRITIIIGSILVLVGVIGYAATSFASWTALIPSIIGALILAFGLIARNPKRQKLGIHAALLIAILGIAGTFQNTLKLGALFAGEAERPAAVIASAITFVLLVVYVALGVRSFVAARRWKTSEGAEKA